MRALLLAFLVSTGGCATLGKVVIPSIRDCGPELAKSASDVLSAIHDPISQIGPLAIDTMADYRCLETQIKEHLAAEKSGDAEKAKAFLVLSTLRAGVKTN